MTYARRRGFDSRADCGLRAPKSISRNVDASRGGVAKHYNGPATRLTKASPHTACRSFWRGVQSHHMDGNGWADVAYTLAVCHHGIVLAGRGVSIRTAAQGTVIGNDRYYAIFHMVGGDERPSVEMLEASAWCVRELRRLGAGREVRPHWFFRPTSCPGPHIPTGNEHNRDIALPDQEDNMPISDDDAVKIAQAVHNQELFRTGITIGGAINTTRQTVAALAPKVAELVSRDPDGLSDAQVDELAHAVSDGLDVRVARRTIDLLRDRLDG